MFFNCDEDEFKELSEKNQIKWNTQFKNNKIQLLDMEKILKIHYFV